MVDIVDRETRSRMMKEIRAKDTKAELLIRRALHSRGFRYRTHVEKLPGKPDIVLPKYHAVVLVNGCFWHGHGCSLFRLPKTRRDFWKSKIDRNRDRDIEVLSLLKSAGWRCLTVWECTIRGPGKREFTSVIDTIESWIKEGNTQTEIQGDYRYPDRPVEAKYGED